MKLRIPIGIHIRFENGEKIPIRNRNSYRNSYRIGKWWKICTKFNKIPIGIPIGIWFELMVKQFLYKIKIPIGIPIRLESDEKFV